MGARSLTAERLREVLDYNPDTGIFVWKIRTADRVKIGTEAGGVDEKGYVRIRVDGGRYRAHRLAWLYVKGVWPSMDIDHEDNNRANNRWFNLREATEGQNRANSRINRNSKTGIKGVREYGRDRWIAGIRVNGKSQHLGIFECVAAAKLAYEVAAVKGFGQFARTA